MGNSVLKRLAGHAPVMKTVSLPRGNHRLHAMPTSAGYEIRTASSYDWDGQRRGQTPFTLMQYTVAGAGNLRVGHRVYRLGPGDTMLLTIPSDHRYWLEPGGRWEFFWISMSGQEAVRIHRAMQAVTGPVLRLRPDARDVIASCCLRLIEGEGETPGSASAIAYEAVMALYDDVVGPFPARAKIEEGAIRAVVDHIRSNLDAALPVLALAEIAGLSRAHFSRLFAVSQGMSPAAFVLHERLRRAARLLAVDPSMPVRQIAQSCGFGDSNYFAKVFRRHFGTSPTEFRTTGMYADLRGQEVVQQE